MNFKNCSPGVYEKKKGIFKMSKNKHRAQVTSHDSDYQKGYLAGLQAAFDESELDAYYTGVGAGKVMNGDKHIGFNSDSERSHFEKGIRDSNKHFKSYRAKPLTWWEKLFGKKANKRNFIRYKSKKSVNRTQRRLKKRRKQRKKTR